MNAVVGLSLILVGYCAYDSLCKSQLQGTRDRQSVLPVTVKQINQIVEDDGVNKLDNVEVFSICLVGTIKSVEAHATNMVYRISDGTGLIECKAYVDKDGASTSKFGDCQ